MDRVPANPVINHHLDGIITIELARSGGGGGGQRLRRRSPPYELPYIMWRLHVSNKHYGRLAVSYYTEGARGFTNIDIAFFVHKIDLRLDLGSNNVFVSHKRNITKD